MKAMQCPALGPPEVLRLVDLPEPEPASGRVVVDVHAAGVNFPDALVVAGTYQRRREPPFVPGSEVAGTVRAVGDGVRGLAPGQRVTAFCGIGGYAEQVAVDARLVHPVPDGVDLTAAAVFPVAYGTAYHALVDRARLRAGETLLVLGASGGTGLAAVGIGHALGARVVAAASSAEKLAVCRAHGAEVLIDYRADDLATRLDGMPAADVVFDPVGGPASDAAVRRLAWGGRFLTVGYASGDIPRVGMNRLLLKEADLLGVLWGEWAVRRPERNAANVAALFGLYGEGALRPHVDASRTLADASEALDAVTGRTATGKIVLRTREDA